jgi:ComF family protein
MNEQTGRAGRGRGVRTWLDGVGSLVFDAPCDVCGQEDGPICSACREEMLDASGPSCPRCAMPVGPFANLDGGCSDCRGRRTGFDEAIALGPYAGPIRHLCLRMKRREGRWAARWGADLLREARGDRLRASGADVITAVPLHWWRQLRRGYNQSGALAEALAARLDLPLVGSLLRSRWTPKLADLPRTRRAALLRGAFRAVMGADLEGKTVMLVDDILTTGATCGASARALKAAGAARVVVVVLARAEGRS